MEEVVHTHGVNTDSAASLRSSNGEECLREVLAYFQDQCSQIAETLEASKHSWNKETIAHLFRKMADDPKIVTALQNTALPSVVIAPEGADKALSASIQAWEQVEKFLRSTPEMDMARRTLCNFFGVQYVR